MDSNSADAQNVSRHMAPDPIDHYHRISLADINTRDVTYRITTRGDIRDLLDTIPSLGLLHPPVLVENSSGYKIVGGFRRIDACRQLGWKHITARIFLTDVDDFKLAQLAIADNALQRSLNPIETSRALHLLVELSPDQKQLQQASLQLGLPIQPSVVRKVLSICRLPSAIQAGILTDTITMSMALELGKLDSADAAALIALFNQLKVGLNRQRELLLLLTEIAKRDDIAIQHLIAEKPLETILKDTEMDRAMRRQHIRAYLRQRRYPALSKAETDYHKWVKQLKLGSDIKLVPPQDFESATYAMMLNFKKRKDLKILKEKIEIILEHPALAKILKQ